MATKWIITSILFLAIIQVHAQFFDFFQDLRPFTYQTIRPINPFSQEITTKRPKTTTTTTKQPHNNQRNKHTNTQDIRPNTRVTSEERDRQTSREKQRRKTTLAPINNTKANRNKSNPNHKNDYSTSSSNIRAEFTNANERNNEFNQPWQDTVNIVQEYTTKPNFGSRNQYTTYNPLYNRPGVKPAMVNTNRPPITNRPATKNPFAVFPRPTDGSAIRYPSDPDDSPQVLTGPDEDIMSDVEKRRYAEVAERMCDKYKGLSVQQVEAIPLLPSPELVTLNITDCAIASVPLVVGGKVVNIREFPHMALLGWTKLEGGGYSWKCGGSLISDRYVLTAAHCAYQERDNSVVIGAPRVVQLGSSYLDDPGSLVVKVSSVYRHPKYTQSRSYYDVAMVKLVKAVTFSAVVKPACLGVPPPVGEKVIATGWGRTEFGGDQSLELRSVSISIWDMQECKRILSSTRKLPNGPSSDSQVCAGEKNGQKDTCQGDSGGPAQVSEGCIWRVVAITSVGRSCGAANTPALYATVHKAFIAAQVFADQIKNEKQNNIRHTDNRPSNTRNSNRDNYQGNRQDYNTEGYRPNNNRQPANSDNYGINNNERNRQSSNTGNFGINNNEANSQSYNNDNYRQNNNRESFNTDSYRQNNNGNLKTDNYQQNNNRESYNTDSYRPNNSNRQTDNYRQNNRQTNNQDNNRQQNDGNNYKNNRYSGYGSEDEFRQTSNSDNSGSTDYNNNRNNYYGTSYNRQRDNYRSSDAIYYPESK